MELFDIPHTFMNKVNIRCKRGEIFLTFLDIPSFHLHTIVSLTFIHLLKHLLQLYWFHLFFE